MQTERRKYYRPNRKAHGHKEFEGKDPLTDCRCPRCGKVHRIRLRWTGRGQPRVYCESCRLTEEIMFGEV
jgi:uncharacterized C2H2 Zn-finger protein